MPIVVPKVSFFDTFGTTIGWFFANVGTFASQYATLGSVAPQLFLFLKKVFKRYIALYHPCLGIVF